MSLFSSQPSIPARVLTDIEWIELEETPYNPPGPELSEDDFEAEFDAAETGLIAVLEQFGRNAAEDADFFHDWTCHRSLQNAPPAVTSKCTTWS